MIQERIRHNLEEVRRRIALAPTGAGRPAADVRLVAVTKKSSPEWIRALLDCGVYDLGENYPQELWRKSEVLADRADAIRWHLIGHLQTNKVKKTLPLVKMIHAVDSLKLLRVLNEAAAALVDPPPVCLQVNTSGEESKHGWSAEEIIEDSESIAACRSIPVVGLMTMAALEGDGRSAHAAHSPGCAKRGTHLRRRQACRFPSFRWACRAISSSQFWKVRRWFASDRRYLRGSSRDRGRCSCQRGDLAGAGSTGRQAERDPGRAGRCPPGRGDLAAREGKGERGDPGGFWLKRWLAG